MSRKGARRTSVRKKQRKAARGGSSQHAMLATAKAAAPASTTADLAQILDKEWFRSHPHRSHRLRRAIPGELPGVSAESHIIVRQAAPGWSGSHSAAPKG
jgi:hypothetical protein